MTEFHLTDIKGVGPARARLLERHGFATIVAIAEADCKELEAVPGVKAMTAAAIQAGARALAARGQRAEGAVAWPDVDAPMDMPHLVDTPLAAPSKKAGRKAKEQAKKDKAKAKKQAKETKKQEKKQEKKDRKKEAKRTKKAAEAEVKRKKDEKKAKKVRTALEQAGTAAKAESKQGGEKGKKPKKGNQSDAGKSKKSSGKKAKG